MRDYSKRLIPMPKNATFGEKEIYIKAISTDCDDFADLISCCLQYSKKLGGFASFGVEAKIEKRYELSAEAYTLDATENSVVIPATEEALNATEALFDELCDMFRARLAYI